MVLVLSSAESNPVAETTVGEDRQSRQGSGPHRLREDSSARLGAWEKPVAERETMMNQ
jgi:hypothetical protein